jgi:hypothetical protein
MLGPIGFREPSRQIAAMTGEQAMMVAPWFYEC